jgi:hypothetical protein
MDVAFYIRFAIVPHLLKLVEFLQKSFEVFKGYSAGVEMVHWRAKVRIIDVESGVILEGQPKAPIFDVLTCGLVMFHRQLIDNLPRHNDFQEASNARTVVAVLLFFVQELNGPLTLEQDFREIK